MNKNQLAAALLLGAAVAGGACLHVYAGNATQRKVGYQDTPMLPGGKWRVHDGQRPQPAIITPAVPSTQGAVGKAPSDAVVLFDGKDTARWRTGDGKASTWKVQDGAMVAGGGDTWTRDEFGDCQIHIEWAAPNPPRGRDQGRGNSGVFLFGRYEIQVLDSYNNITYPDGQAGSMYGQYPPLVNASLKPGEWQTYDIFFTAPRFKDGKVETPAYLTLMHNGVLVHNHTPYLGPSGHRSLPEYRPHAAKGPIKLQDHGNPTRFRNIWVRPLKSYDEP